MGRWSSVLDLPGPRVAEANCGCASLPGIEREQSLDLLGKTTQEFFRRLGTSVVRFARDMPGHEIQIADADLHRNTRRSGSDLILNSLVEIHQPREEQFAPRLATAQARPFRLDR